MMLYNGVGLPSILLAEDDDNDAFGIELACKTTGHLDRFRRVSSGQEAVDYLSGNGLYQDRARYPLPTLILLDWSMPDFSGVKVLRWVRRHPLLKHLAVVVLSGLADTATKQKAFELGANSFVEKPGTFLEVQEMIDSMVRFWRFNQVPDLTDTPQPWHAVRVLGLRGPSRGPCPTPDGRAPGHHRR